jgi:hypothetical protein
VTDDEITSYQNQFRLALFYTLRLRVIVVVVVVVV